jgi:hypothetical protein
VEQAKPSISRAHIKGGVHGPHISLGDGHQRPDGGKVDGELAGTGAGAVAGAVARDWKALRVSGNEEFKRVVWLEASARGVKTVGYEPSPADIDLLKKERDARQLNRIEPERSPISSSPGPAGATTPTEKASARGGGGRKAVLVAIEAVLVAKNVPEKQREAVMAAATDKLTQRPRESQAPKVKVYDKSAPPQRPVTVPTPEVQRTRERAAPGR